MQTLLTKRFLKGKDIFLWVSDCHIVSRMLIFNVGIHLSPYFFSFSFLPSFLSLFFFFLFLIVTKVAENRLLMSGNRHKVNVHHYFH